MTHDRMHSDEFLLTQEFLAMMLGVRRTGVTAAAGALQRAGLIRYKRGNVSIIDRRGLKRRSCECYEFPRGSSIACSMIKQHARSVPRGAKTISQYCKAPAVCYWASFRRLLAEGANKNRSLLVPRAILQTRPCPIARESEPGSFEHPETTGYEVRLLDLPAPKAPNKA